MVKDEGKEIVKAKIIAGIGEMVEGLPHVLTRSAINRLADFIIENHFNLKLPEFKIISNRLLRKEMFGKLSINTIAREIDLYWTERLDFAENKAIKEASEQKGTIAHVSLLKTFNEAMELRKQKKEIVKQAERARIAEIRRINDEKATKLKREFANDYKPA